MWVRFSPCQLTINKYNNMRKFNHKNVFDVLALAATILTSVIIIGGTITLFANGSPNLPF